MKFEPASRSFIQGYKKAVKENTVFECHTQEIKTSKTTGKQYKKWIFIGWSLLPDLNRFPNQHKGEWLHVEEPSGYFRYNIGEVPFASGVVHN